MKKARIILSLALIACMQGSFGANVYIDPRNGNDINSGSRATSAWRSTARLQEWSLQPGDTVFFKRGAVFTGPVNIKQSGAPGRYIVLRDYGNASAPAPRFTNPVFAEGNYGNCIRISGSYVQVENLYFTGTSACTDVKYSGEGWLVWEMGAIHIARGAEHCIVRNNEINDCVAGIRSNGEYAKITGNYIHDCNRPLKRWNWGPLGIWLGADHQEISYNRIINYSVVDPNIGWGADSYGSGADGGAMEIDDARYPKSDISIHHNYSRDCQGFLEVTWTDVKQNPAYSRFHIHHNVSDDYQQFLALWRGEDCLIENNTIIRRKKNANDWGVFNITQRNGRNRVRNNIVVTEKNIVVFNTGRKGTARPATVISDNLYYAASGSLVIGNEGPGIDPVFADPQFRKYGGSAPEDFSILPGSAAIATPNNPEVAGKQRAYIGAFDYNAKSPTAREVTLAKNGAATVNISLLPGASPEQRFAAEELVKYLQQMSGAVFSISYEKKPGHSIVLRTTTIPEDDYRIAVRNGSIWLTGGSGRSVLYAVYDLLRHLGCEWVAPEFSFYNSYAGYVPLLSTLIFKTTGDIYEHPRFTYRKIDVEEGRSHNLGNLRQLIDWMPKARLNVLMVPLNYQGAGRVKWERWRDSLTPELKKRGILLEVGGHGYQNFLNARMEGGKLFTQHPEWFGRNKECLPDTTENLVFNTSNPAAMHYFITNVLQFLREHPEINIFDCWPPDVAKWAECPDMKALGTPEDRQAKLINQLDSAIRTLTRGIKLEVIAYGQVLGVPLTTPLSKNVLVDICPINQTFENNMYDTLGNVNAAYANAILRWKKYFEGELGHYSYYRKYAWYSMPVIIPNYMQRDMQWYAKLPMQGISTYAEPGDWYTYELNHYALANLAWNTSVNMDSLVKKYTALRYGQLQELASEVYTLLEDVVRNTGSIPYTSLKKSDVIQRSVNRLEECRQKLIAAVKTISDNRVRGNTERLFLMLDYAVRDLEILELRAQQITGKEFESKIRSLVDMLESHAGEGVFILRGGNNFTTFLKHYKNIR